MSLPSQPTGPPDLITIARSRRGLITIALLLAMAVAALEQTVVSTAMASIIAQLHGLDIYPWVFSAYLLAATVSTPVYGKLADIWGRKHLLLFGLAVFSLGSILSGMAQSMPQLIAFRVVQGLGAGALGPIVLTILGDLFTLEERAKVQGLFSAVWGASSLAGPSIGGYLCDSFSWRSVFFITLPFSFFSAWILLTQVEEKVEKRKGMPIDWLGAFLLTIASSLILLTVLHGHEASGTLTLGLAVASVVFVIAFIAQERRAADPVLPIDLFQNLSISAAIASSFMIGVLMFGIETYIPLFVQGVTGGSALSAGGMITPLFLSWSISVAIAAKVVVRLGFKRTAVIGTILITAGMSLLALGAVFPPQSRPLFLLGMAVIGMGMGPSSLSQILGVQNSVDWGRRGAATASILFFRTMGGALGVGALGASLGFELSRRLQGLDGVEVAAALRPETHHMLTPSQLAAVQDALGRSLRDVFLEMVAIGAIAIVCAFGLRGGRAVSRGTETSETTSEDPVPAAMALEH